MLAGAPRAEALITPPVTVDGPASSILEFGGVAMAKDGSGGVTYVKSVGGVRHVFACRFVEGRWSPPVQVDWDQPYPASQPRIAAGPKGELLVLWVTQVATVHGKVRYGLFSARLGHGAAAFAPSLLVDPNVGEGIGVAPSVSATAPGQAIVAYRAITYDFNPNEFSTAVQLRPGDVMADIRLARLKGDRWSRIGAVNRNAEASMRPPSPTDGPQVATADNGEAAVAWQEPDQTGAARIWLRRVFGTTPGPPLEASPTSWEGKPVTADADALSLAVSPLAQVRVAFRIAATSGSPLSGRLLLNTLPKSSALGAAALTGAQLADGGPAPGEVGPPSVAASDEGGVEGSMRLGFVAGSQPRQIGVDAAGSLSAVPTPAVPAAQPGGGAVTAIDPEGGGLVAYPALDPVGRPAVAVRQEYPSGAAQTGILFGAQGGPVSDLAIGRSGRGDGLIAFLQGEPGHYEVVAERASAPPASFEVEAPSGWVKPAKAMLRWQAAGSAVGEVRYSVLVAGRTIKAGLRRLRFHPRPAQTGSGIRPVRVLATDGLGQQLLSRAVKLRVDGERPIVGVKVRRGRGVVALRVVDVDSGLRVKRCKVRFGDGTKPLRLHRARGHGRKRRRSGHGGRGRRPAAYALSHAYAHGGRYRVVVRATDRVGNRIVRRFDVRVR